MKKELLVVYVILFLCISHAFGQVKKQEKVKVRKGFQVILMDTTFIAKRDTTLLLDEDQVKKLRIRENPYLQSSQFYDSLEERASGNKISADIFDLVVKKKKRTENLVNAIVKSEDIFKPYAGYTIGSITFKGVDMLEGSVIDTLQEATTKFGKFVNKVHRDTRAVIIKQNLLFKVGDVVDPYKLADNERVLRQFKTLRDVRIYLRRNKKLPKVVDVVVVTQDVTSIGVSGDYSSLQKFRLDLYDINILGYAKQLQVSYFRSPQERPRNGYEITLREQNLFHTFIEGELQYTENYLRQRTRLSLGRDFFTPEIKYAGGFDIYRTRENFYFEEYDTLVMPYTENNIDAWAGRSFQFKKRVNIIFSARINPRNFVSAPFVSPDSNSFFYDRTLFLGSATIIKRNFLKSLRIRGFGKTEDIPVGGAVSILFGREVNQFVDRPYFELSGTFGKYYPTLGYINLSLGIGSFFRSGTSQDGLISITTTYFTDLYKKRRTQMRQFVFFTYTRGFNRILDQTISLRGKWEDNDERAPLGNQRTTVGLETVYFMPWYTYGFQFALFHRFDINLLSDEAPVFQKSSVFYAIRAGTRILNENLVLPAFSMELSYYGKNQNYPSAWELKVSTTLPNLFGTTHVFRPEIKRFE